jgi:hypothetical protein
MSSTSNISLTISFKNPSLDAEERDRQARRLLEELRSMNEVNSVNRVYDANLPEGSKALGGFLVGLLKAEVNIENSKHLLSFLRERLGGKQIELEVEANGRCLKVKAYSREELEAAIKAAQDFIKE